MIPRPLNRRCKEAAFYKRLEPYAGKLARTVLRGVNGSNVVFLLGVFKCTQSLLNSKSKQYPSHYGSDRTARYKADIAAGKTCADCVGACKGYAWNNGKKKAEVPDKSANGMFSYAKSKGADWGTIDTLPELPGVALRFDGHVGYYIGNGYAIEWRGFAYGCVRTKVSGRKWTHWYRLPWIDYGEGTLTAPVETALGSRVLKNGSVGSDVKKLQELLVKLGYDVGGCGIDGDYGADTAKAVKLFQARSGLKQDGQYGENTHKALMAAVADAEGVEQESTEEPAAETVVEQPSVVDTEEPALTQEESAKTTMVEITGNSVNIRKGNGAQYGRITTVNRGTTFEYVATAGNGWNAVVVNGQVGWVSDKYSKVV